MGIALSMLFGERGKYWLLLSGIGASTILMVQGLALGFGIMSYSYGTLDNIRSPIWVVDPKVVQVNDRQPLRDTDVDRVRSVDGVAWAVPLFIGDASARIVKQGLVRNVKLVGLDNTTLFGAPAHLLSGSLEDLRQPDAVLISEATSIVLGSDPAQPLRIGDIFEMNDHAARVVGICRTKKSSGGGEYVFTPYDRAVQYVPTQRKTVTHILVIPEAGHSASAIARSITARTGLKALTEDQFRTLTAQWWLDTEPAPIVIEIIVVIGFIVGTIVSGQTFYMFVVENTRYLGVLRAMGTQAHTLAAMILLQALFVGMTGYGLGLGLISFLFMMLPKGLLPLLMLWQVPASVFAAIVTICAFAALLGIWRVVRIESAIVFR